MNKALLQQMISEGYIKVNKHPKVDLYIYNYTQTVQFEGKWNEITLACRGLILNEQLEYIARPFPKFFNLGEPNTNKIPNLPYEIYDKMDGSLGILYWIQQTPYIASRGSFNSEQALKATEMLHTTYKKTWEKLNPKKTYLFEIIYPENRIVLDYGTTESLVLLGIIDTQTGIEEPLENLGFPIVEKIQNNKDFETLAAANLPNKEGFVIKYQNGFRLKIKFEEYVRLHRIITQISSVDIWEHLKNQTPLDEMITHVPDEFYSWVKDCIKKLKNNYHAIEKQSKDDFKILETRKETAAYFLKCAYPSVLFLMLDGKDYQEDIWKRIRPTFEKPFANTTEE